MHYLIYKITNKINNKIYIGKHITSDKNDNYFGSGTLLKRSISKHGKENFIKEILYECASKEEMDRVEGEIVDEEFVARLDTYNILLGGDGGFHFVNENNLNNKNHSKDKWEKTRDVGRSTFKRLISEDVNFRNEFRKKMSNIQKLYQSVHGNHFFGKKHSEETKKMMSVKMREIHSGDKNPNYGKIWITNGEESKMIGNGEIPEGWRKGRIGKHKSL